MHSDIQKNGRELKRALMLKIPSSSQALGPISWVEA